LGKQSATEKINGWGEKKRNPKQANREKWGKTWEETSKKKKKKKKKKSTWSLVEVGGDRAERFKRRN